MRQLLALLLLVLVVRVRHETWNGVRRAVSDRGWQRGKAEQADGCTLHGGWVVRSTGVGSQETEA